MALQVLARTDRLRDSSNSAAMGCALSGCCGCTKSRLKAFGPRRVKACPSCRTCPQELRISTAKSAGRRRRCLWALGSLRSRHARPGWSGSTARADKSGVAGVGALKASDHRVLVGASEKRPGPGCSLGEKTLRVGDDGSRRANHPTSIVLQGHFHELPRRASGSSSS